MQRFFPSLRELDHFTHSLDSLTVDDQCQHCSRTDQWISHGYVCNKSGEKVGKRILCGSRYGKQGCGRTRQLYLQHLIPQRRYTLSKLLTLIVALIKGCTVEQAYYQAIGHDHSAHRQAWRWLNALWARMSRLRAELASPPDSGAPPAQYRSRRLSILLSTLSHWLSRFPDKQVIQAHLQERFC